MPYLPKKDIGSSGMSESVELITLGCPKNDVDSEVVGQILVDSGHTLTTEQNGASTVFINTCGFIEDAKKESIDRIKEAINRKKAGQIKNIIVAGCLVGRYRKDLEERFKDVDAFFEVSDFDSIKKYFQVFNGKPGVMDRYRLTPKHFAYLKISEGCDYKCSFCAIPGIRGLQKSRPLNSLLDEARRLIDNGVCELILIAEDSTRYGIDLDTNEDLCKLLENLSNLDGLKWIRLLYAYPKSISDRLIDIIGERDNICNYIDMPIQHVSNTVLKRMKRTYKRRDIEDKIEKLRNRIPDIILRTTVIVGFPGETKEQFVELSNFLMESPFDRLGAFMYSDEDGTQAESLDNKVSKNEMIERLEEIQLNQNYISEQVNRQLIGKKLEVLVDYKDEESDMFLGRSYGDAPSIDQVIQIDRPAEVGEFTTITVEDSTATELTGK